MANSGGFKTQNHRSENRSLAGKSNTRTSSHRNEYIYDNTARKLDVVRELETAPKKKQSREVGRNRAKAHVMSLGYVVFLVAALFVCGYVLANYVQLTSEVTAKSRRIAALESELNTMRVENDEAYNRIVTNIDLEKIREIAISELGMTYANENQIVIYESVGMDYMRKSSGN